METLFYIVSSKHSFHMRNSTKVPPVKRGRPSTKQDGMDILKIENNVPMPQRGIRDPEFVSKVVTILSQIKPKQSFVVPKKKAHAVKKVCKSEQHSHMVVRMAVIKPEERFVRVWRVG